MAQADGQRGANPGWDFPRAKRIPLPGGRGPALSHAVCSSAPAPGLSPWDCSVIQLSQGIKSAPLPRLLCYGLKNPSQEVEAVFQSRSTRRADRPAVRGRSTLLLGGPQADAWCLSPSRWQSGPAASNLEHGNRAVFPQLCTHAHTHTELMLGS